MPVPPALAERLAANHAAELRRARLYRGAFARLLTSLASADAIVFGRRVFLSRPAASCVAQCGSPAEELLAHELAHVRQYRRFGAAAFLGRYVGEYLGRRLAGATHRDAYRAISFECEAEEASVRCRLAAEGDRRAPP